MKAVFIPNCHCAKCKENEKFRCRIHGRIIPGDWVYGTRWPNYCYRGNKETKPKEIPHGEFHF